VKQVSGKEFVKILERHGWRLLRINGSHHIMAKEGRWSEFQFPFIETNL
jgi:predicted RNA binding protein YcfA (HicA-like mRNA interferase family)